MNYSSVKDYLNDQFRLPILNAIKENDVADILCLVDFICDKYIETNAFAKGFEDYAKEKGVELKIGFLDFYKQYVVKNLPKKDWEKCEAPFSEEIFNVKELNEIWKENKKDDD